MLWGSNLSFNLDILQEKTVEQLAIEIASSIKGQINIVGFSSGGYIAQEIIRLSPDKKYAEKAGLTIENFSGHSLRSGFITSGAAAGADFFKLMEVSRHKKPETVMGYVREPKLFENHAGEKFL